MVSFSFAPGYNRKFEEAGQGLFVMEAFAERIFFYRKNDGRRPLSQGDSVWDYVVCVMDRRIGEELGYFGSIEYDDDWDDEDYWGNAGYPLNPGGVELPFFQNQPFRVLDEYDGGDVDDGVLLRAEGDFTEGQSGSPVFGTFVDDIKVIGLFSGGGTLPDLSGDQGNFLPAGKNFVELIKSRTIRRNINEKQPAALSLLDFSCPVDANFCLKQGSRFFEQ